VASHVEQHSQALHRLPPGVTTEPEREAFERLQGYVADARTFVSEEVEAMLDARLYWVARDMVQLAVRAAEDLPAWTPAEAMPAPNGFLCWAKPAGRVPYAPESPDPVNVTWDAVWWWTRPDGILQIQPATRLKSSPEVPNPIGVRAPLWATGTIWLDASRARTEEANGSEDMHPFISVVGAAWLLMGQTTLTESRVIGQTEVGPTSGGSEPAEVRKRRPAPVTIVELRREIDQHNRSAVKGSKRQYRGRWMVGWPNGFWRQQAYGPGRSLRKPVLIAPHTAGPQGAQLLPPKQKVYVWRK
jgi:hypothetical protein